MTKDQAEIILLRHALQDAQSTVSFLHGCLTDPSKYKYCYPEHTVDRLKEWNQLAPIEGSSCHHSMTKNDCPSCMSGQKMHQEQMEALKVFNS